MSKKRPVAPKPPSPDAADGGLGADGTLAATLARYISARAADGQAPLVVGICGAQGSGKSTVARALQGQLDLAGLPTVTFSLDDLYLRHDERQQLARSVHPLLAARGVPGTHDVDLGISVLDSLIGAHADTVTPIPSFDKATDDQVPRALWPVFTGRPRVILFEGWCVGARAQDEDALAQPVNDLEREEDPDGVWRHHVNDRLANEYQDLFSRIDLLALLKAPSFEQVFSWRRQQEEELRQKLAQRTDGRQGFAGVMNDDALDRFIRHYERLTRHILAEMPYRADITALLRRDRTVASVAII